ncbi:hypothetical protein HDE77_002813 [Rhodanobacter sp. MP7CTX1]|nr:hypothetical protein [Rhodanobacter sp. MP7CTX1]
MPSSLLTRSPGETTNRMCVTGVSPEINCVWIGGYIGCLHEGTPAPTAWGIGEQSLLVCIQETTNQNWRKPARKRIESMRWKPGVATQWAGQT